MKMELKSFPKYMKHIEKMESKKDKLREQIEKNEHVIAGMKESYSILFAEDQDTSVIAKKLAKVEDETNGLKREYEIISKSDFSPTKLAHEIRDEYDSLMKEVEAERDALWMEGDRIKQEARDKVEQLNQRREELANQFNIEVAKHQFSEVINGLDISEDAKQSLRYQVENGPIRAWVRIPELKIQ
ncbi:hypothetical protein V7201_10760 [Bacillus sp. JJ1122]|uniref:hypothetical protein n=1 Tax=Bacillus sp. JJ1122 TaxID=3122951 RepID=UPI002FFDAD1C